MSRELGLSAPRATELKPRIVVFGIGGAGGNAVNNMIEAGLEGVEFVVANTDAQHLAFAKTDARIQLGETITQGLGAGAHPEVGMNAAEESADEIHAHLEGAHMVFITAGMGGGTGTGAAPIIAKCARDRGILTVGVVTKPFTFEGRHRMRLADAGIAELQRYVDTLIVIPNQNLFRIANERTGFAEAFGMADQVLHAGVRSITDLMVLPGLINLDFADVRTVMSEMGKAMMGTGEATGEDRAVNAAHNAIQNPLLDETSLKGAKAVLVNITGGMDMTLLEVDEAANTISAEVDPDANIIFGAAFDPALDGVLRVSVVATGMDDVAIQKIEAPVQPQRAQPVAQQPAPAPAPAVAPAFSGPEPMRAEAVRDGAFGHRQPEPAVRRAQAELEVAARTVEQREAPAAAAQPEPQAPAQEQRVIGRIVDPSVAEAEEGQGELYLSTPAPQPSRPVISQPAARAAEPAPRQAPPAYEDDSLFVDSPDSRRSAGGGRWSLFGRRRQEPTLSAPQAQLRPVQQAQPVEPEAAADEQDDLEIPSFLRRLAN